MKRRDLGAFWHALVGFVGGVVTGAVAALTDQWALPVSWIFVIGVFGWLREVAQHDWHLTWPHQVFEAAAWGLGAVAGVPVGIMAALIWLAA